MWIPDIKKYALAAVVCFFGPSAAAESVWGVTSDLVTSDGDGRFCEMATAWRDGRNLSIWLNEHQYLGFSLMNSAWSLPQGLESYVTFVFGDGSQHTFSIEAVSETHAIGGWETADGVEFIRRFAGYWRMEVYFPQGESWVVNLTGSNAALQQWLQCANVLWDEGDSPSASNPFGAGRSSGSSPFE